MQTNYDLCIKLSCGICSSFSLFSLLVDQAYFDVTSTLVFSRDLQSIWFLFQYQKPSTESFFVDSHPCNFIFASMFHLTVFALGS